MFVKFKKPSKTAVVLIAGVTISGTPCLRHITVPFGAEAPSGHLFSGLSNPTSFQRPAFPMAPTTDNKLNFCMVSAISKFLRPAQRHDDFKLIRITCRADARHGKTEHGIFVKFKKPSKTAVVLIDGVHISGIPCLRYITVPFGAEAPSGHVAQA